jgi:predicted nucleic acid binding AN1-type Zn finger protein
MTKRCFKCKKKLLILMECACGKKFCFKHRYAEQHECTFDYKARGKKDLKKNNPKIEYKKINRI